MGGIWGQISPRGAVQSPALEIFKAGWTQSWVAAGDLQRSLPTFPILWLWDIHPNPNEKNWEKVLTCLCVGRRSHFLHPAVRRAMDPVSLSWHYKNPLGHLLGRPNKALQCFYCLPSPRDQPHHHPHVHFSTLMITHDCISDIPWQQKQRRTRLNILGGCTELHPAAHRGQTPKFLELI